MTAAPALELLEEVGPAALHAHALGLANRFRDGVGAPAGDSAIVALAVDGGAEQALRAARVVGSTRAGRLRLAFHVSTGPDDVDRAVRALRPHLMSRR